MPYAKLFVPNLKHTEKLGKQMVNLQKVKQKTSYKNLPKSNILNALLKKFMLPARMTEARPSMKPKKMKKNVITQNIFIDGIPKYISKDLNNVNQIKDTEQHETIKITTIVETIRQRNKRNAEMFGDTNNNEKKVTVKRSKRSAREKRVTVSPDDDNIEHQDSSLEGFYRHPKFSYEEQQNKSAGLELLSDTDKSSDADKNSGDSGFYKRIWGTADPSQPKFKIVVTPTKSQKHKYIPVFPKCNDTTDNSEIRDSNGTLPHSEGLNLEKRDTGSNGNDSNHAERSVNNENRLRQEYESTTESRIAGSNQDYLIALTSLEDQRKNKAYVDLLGNEKNENQTAQSDIPHYNPDNIPYVEVPDYSDVREESLDEEDRRANKENVRHEDTDFVDPEMLADLEEISKPSNVSGSTLYAPLRIEEADEEPSPRAVVQHPIPHNSETTEGFDTNLNDKVLKDSNSKEDASKEELKHLVDRESQETLQEAREPESSTLKIEPVLFDINEYRKPFNFEEFLKDDPILEQLDLVKKELYPRYKKNSEDSPSRLDESETKEEYGSSYAKGDNFGEDLEQDNKKDNSGSSKTDLYKVHEDAAEDEDFLKSMFNEDKKEKQSPSSEGEKEFLSRYFIDDFIKKMRDDTDDQNSREKKDVRYNEDMQKALSTILSKKDHISRLDEDIDKKIQSGETSPVMYKNFWTLEYKTPYKNDESETKGVK